MRLRRAGNRSGNSSGFVFSLLCFLCFALGCGAHPESSVQVSLRWVGDPADAGKQALEVSGLSAHALENLQRVNWQSSDWQRLLAVFVAPADGASGQDLPPMAGNYRVQGAALRFEPQFPLQPGVSYRAVFHPAQLPGAGGATGNSISALYQAPLRKEAPTTAVSRIYPSADVVPENLLKFYVQFSAPMSRGRIYEHIHLRTAAGRQIELPFLEIDEELWDASGTRLTLFIDPGRIKRGVKPLEEIGPALEAGQSYALVIDRAWRDGAGNPLKEDFQKAFRVGPPDRTPVDPTRWQVQAPIAGTRAPLALAFPDPLDYALAQRLIAVADEAGQAVAGATTLERQERSWKFVPVAEWQRGRYTLVVQPTLEDLAGNNIGKAFDVDMGAGGGQPIAAVPVKLPFEVR